MLSESTAKPNRPPIGNYQVVAHVATGGMGAVYKARDTQLGRDVALKVLLPDQAAKKPLLLKRFLLEARYGGRLNHENIVTLYEYGEVHGIHFLALEYVDGVSLQEYIASKGTLAVDESRQIILQAARAIGHLHKHGIIHRDIKPSNFLVTFRNGRPFIKLIDLGLARRVTDEGPRLTLAGTTLGTVDYLAPEQARDSGAADVRSDIYSLGCTWYHMLAGRPPFAEGNVTERIYKHVTMPPPDVCKVNPAVPEAVRAIINKMLAKEPAKRYQTPEELLPVLEGRVATAREAAPAPHPAPEPKTPPIESSGSRLDLLASLAEAESPSDSGRRGGRRDHLRRQSAWDDSQIRRETPRRTQEWKFLAIGVGGIAAVLLVVLVIILLQPSARTTSSNRGPQEGISSPAPVPANERSSDAAARHP